MCTAKAVYRKIFLLKVEVNDIFSSTVIFFEVNKLELESDGVVSNEQVRHRLTETYVGK